ncbi:MAG: S1C family serine protease, partial [Gemmataceae bacterium]
MNRLQPMTARGNDFVSRRFIVPAGLLALSLVIPAGRIHGDDSFSRIADEVNPKLVKLFGSGGFKGLAAYGTGALVSRDGYILTVNSHILDTRDLVIHLHDGTRHNGKVVAREPALDIALVKIEAGRKPLEIETFFDPAQAAKRPIAEPGTHVLAFSNQFQIATRDEPMSIQRGVIAAYARLYGRLGIFEATYRGNVYVIDAITNNPGAGGGVVTTRRGELLALVGKELRNELTNTWINYAVPLSASIDVPDKDGKKVTVSIMDVVTKKENYKPIPEVVKTTNLAFHGIVLVPNVVERTPPYIEEVLPGSPADKANLRPDDLIVYLDGLPVQDINSFNNLLA